MKEKTPEQIINYLVELSLASGKLEYEEIMKLISLMSDLVNSHSTTSAYHNDAILEKVFNALSYRKKMQKDFFNSAIQTHLQDLDQQSKNKFLKFFSCVFV